MNRYFEYTEQEWRLAKILTLLLWVYPVIKVLKRYTQIPYPEGVCLFFDFTFLLQPTSVVVISALIVGFSLLYVLERNMLVATLGLALISVVVFSIERSNGIYHRKELLSSTFIVQFIAYLRYTLSGNEFKSNNKVHNLAIMYTVQIIAAGYMISGISKIQNSGISWVLDSPNIVIQMIKSFTQKAIDTEWSFMMSAGNFLAYKFVHYPNLIRFMFGSAWLIELFAVYGMLSKSKARTMSIFILLLHLGILLMMGVVLVAFVGLVMIYLLNIPQYLLRLSGYFTKGYNSAYYNNGPDFHFFKDRISYTHFVLPFTFIIITNLAGENHPFSRFQMYSGFPSSVDYFYLADENRKPICAYHNFHFRTNELKDMLQISVSKHNYNRNSTADLKLAASEVIDIVTKRNEGNPKLEQFTSLSVIRHQISIVDHRISESDTLLVSVNIR